MRNANVTLTINLNMSVPELMRDDKIEGSAYWLIKPFLDDFDGEINGCKLLGNSVNIETRFTNVNCSIPNYIAEEIVLEDDADINGGISHIGETLDEFISESRGAFEKYGADDGYGKFIYDIPFGVVNNALNECGIKMITSEQRENALERAIKKLS